MNISLPTELEQYLDREIASGKFRSQAEAIAEALWLLRRREEQLDRLKNEIQSGIDELDRGQFSTISSPEDEVLLMQEVERVGCREEEKADD